MAAFFDLLYPFRRLFPRPPDRHRTIDHDPHGPGVCDGPEVYMHRDKQGYTNKADIMQKVRPDHQSLVCGEEPDNKAGSDDTEAHPEHAEVGQLLARVQLVHRWYRDLMTQIASGGLDPCDVILVEHYTFPEPNGHAQD